jgi:hypothetical protein
MLGVAHGGVLEEGVDRGEPGVAGPDAVAAVVFQAAQERADPLWSRSADSVLFRQLRG